MNLKSRVQKLETTNSNGNAEVVTPEEAARRAEYEEYLQYLLSEAFRTELQNKVTTAFATMNDEYVRLILDDCQNVLMWRAGELEAYPYSCRITDYWIQLLIESLHGGYVGPLALPAAIAEYWRDYQTSKSSVYINGVDCEDCGYLMPSAEQFGAQWVGVPHTGKDYSNMRCLLCGGKCAADAYPRKHPDMAPMHYDHKRKEQIKRAKMGFTFNRCTLRRKEIMLLIACMFKQSDGPVS